MEGEIAAVGPGDRDEKGAVAPLDVKHGDRILFDKWSGSEIKFDGEDLLIMNESDASSRTRVSPSPRRKRCNTNRIVEAFKQGTRTCRQKTYVSAAMPAPA
jgi:hypothetical protein